MIFPFPAEASSIDNTAASILSGYVIVIPSSVLIFLIEGFRKNDLSISTCSPRDLLSLQLTIY